MKKALRIIKKTRRLSREQAFADLGSKEIVGVVGEYT